MGIKEGMRGIVIAVPNDVLKLFKSAPLDIREKLADDFDYIHLFSKDEKELRMDVPNVKKFLKTNGILWVSWPKSGKLNTNLNENTVRDIGLASGLVDIKVAAIDDTWSGLKFMYRLKDR